jgi:hypothetical protein
VRTGLRRPTALAAPGHASATAPWCRRHLRVTPHRRLRPDHRPRASWYFFTSRERPALPAPGAQDRGHPRGGPSHQAAPPRPTGPGPWALVPARGGDRLKQPGYRARPRTTRAAFGTRAVTAGFAVPGVPEKLPMLATISNHWRMSHGLRADAGPAADGRAAARAAAVAQHRPGNSRRTCRTVDRGYRRIMADTMSPVAPAGARPGREHAGSTLTARRHDNGCVHPTGTGPEPHAAMRRVGDPAVRRGPRAGRAQRREPSAQSTYRTPDSARLPAGPGAASPRGPRRPGPRWRTG